MTEEKINYEKILELNKELNKLDLIEFYVKGFNNKINIESGVICEITFNLQPLIDFCSFNHLKYSICCVGYSGGYTGMKIILEPKVKP